MNEHIAHYQMQSTAARPEWRVIQMMCFGTCPITLEPPVPSIL
jgi:hypothetical protein